MILLYTYWWDGWPPNSHSKRLFAREFDFPVSVDAPITAPSKYWLRGDVVGLLSQPSCHPEGQVALAWPTVDYAAICLPARFAGRREISNVAGRRGHCTRS
jgi:hypothetical protein